MGSVSDIILDIMKVEIAKLELGENDYLVLKFPKDSKYEFVMGVMDKFGKMFPELDGRVMLFSDDIQISIVGKTV